MSEPVRNESEAVRPYAACLAVLRDAGLRPTRHRLTLARLLFSPGEHRHVTAEALHAEAAATGSDLSLATVYNALHQFTKAGLLRELVIESGRTYFDTNTAAHHHFYHPESGNLYDIDYDDISLGDLPTPPDRKRVSGVHVLITLED